MKRILAFALVLTHLISCEPRKEQSTEEWKNMHSDIFHDLLADVYFIYCLNEPLDVLKMQFAEGDFDSIHFAIKIDSLKEVRMKEMNKCEITLDQRLRVNPSSLLKTDWLLQKPFYNDYFAEYSEAQLLDSLTEASKIKASDLYSDYVNVVKFDKETQGIFGKGVGIISFSKTLFSSDGNKAILYYEFVCGSSCGDGVVIFVEKKNTKWHIVQKTTLWNY